MDFEKLIADNSPDATIVTSPEGCVLHWSARAEAVFGFSAEDAVGRDLSDLIVPPVPDARHGAEPRSRHAVEFTQESLRRKQDGALIFADTSALVVRDAAGRAQYVISSHRDVTDSKTQRDAKRATARYGEVLESTPDGIVMLNAAGRIVLANSHAEAQFGYEHGELQGKLVEALLPQRFVAGHVGHRSGYFAKPRVRSMGAGLELFGLRKDGSEFPVEISLSPIDAEEGVLVMSAIRDISSRKRIERDLYEKNVELERASQAKDRFLASMSHELRTPLNAIIGFTGTLLMKLPGPLTFDQEKQLRTIQSSARHLLSLINDLLDVAKIESGKVDLAWEDVDCIAMLAELAETLRPAAQQKQISLDIHEPPERIFVRADRRLLNQILINLVNNAIKFTDRGAVRVSMSRVEGASGPETRIAVADTGIGIRQEDMHKLFQAFSQLDNASTRRYDGTGLGLHLCQRLARLLGGDLTAQSEFGKGSTFALTLAGRPTKG